MRPISTDKAPAAIGPYNQAIAVPAGGEMIFCSGQIPIDPSNGQLLDGDCAAQATLVLSNLAAVLDAAGCTFADVVKTTIYLTDMGDFAAVNAVYAEAMDGHRPARATVAVSGLPKGVAVEIDAIAVRQP
ncbi:MAG: 2-iminobutanoate/2-iminopropanoate deaminase [Myxococcota bacterium]|jgi:2-iminobutanoate/2-iminopropanoate deaminase